MAGPPRLSTEEIMKVARARYSKLSSQRSIDVSMIKHFFDANQLGLSGEEIKDVELVLLLLAAAHKFDGSGTHKQTNLQQATSFLNLCQFLSSNTGNSVQRLVQCFTRALREKIDRETGMVTLEELETKTILHPQEMTEILNPALIACSLQIPYLQVMQFTSIQAVIEGLASARKVHFIDLAIRNGGHCTVLIQALANRRECPVDHLKITAVGTKSQQKIDEIGKRLACFAETVHVPFSFRTAMVSTLKDLKEDMFELSDSEVVAVYLPVILRNIKAQPVCLDSLIKVLRNLNPCVLVSVEFEANHNSSIFMERFIEALCFYGAYFDCLDDCIDRSDPSRMTKETMLGQEIRDIVAAEGKDRVFQHMKMEEWREYFARYQLVETELSMSSIFHAQLALKNFASGKSCTLDRDGKCLIACWKGTPILSVSSWKFQEENSRKSCIPKKCKSY